MKSPSEIFHSQSLFEISFSQWEEIVQWEDIQCTEYEIILALSKRCKNFDQDNLNEIQKKIIPHIRLGHFHYYN